MYAFLCICIFLLRKPIGAVLPSPPTTSDIGVAGRGDTHEKKNKGEEEEAENLISADQRED